MSVELIGPPVERGDHRGHVAPGAVEHASPGPQPEPADGGGGGVPGGGGVQRRGAVDHAMKRPRHHRQLAGQRRAPPSLLIEHPRTGPDRAGALDRVRAMAVEVIHKKENYMKKTEKQEKLDNP